MSSHQHPHTPAPDTGDAMPSYYEIMETAVRERELVRGTACFARHT